MTVLSVAYPLAPVRENTAGGAEQVLAMLDAALTRAGHHSVVVACEGSRVTGTLVATPRHDGPFNERAILDAQARHRAAIRNALGLWPADVIHMHSQDFDAYLPDAGVPVIVTLHVPFEWYGPAAMSANAHYVFVSETQRRAWPAAPRNFSVIPNGVDAEAFRTRVTKRGFALALGRVAPEKGTALALEAARRAGVPMLVAGEVYRYAAHERYFREEVAPLLDGSLRVFVGRLRLARKRRLLTAARCVVAASRVAETSSLTAMEAMACGTPVVAFPAGALAEIVEHGRTGFVVNSVDEMAAAIRHAGAIDPSECRRAARERFPASRTIAAYFQLYETLAGSRAWSLSA
ncbi:MAG: glycosyltransferase [bacterium]